MTESDNPSQRTTVPPLASEDIEDELVMSGAPTWATAIYREQSRVLVQLGALIATRDERRDRDLNLALAAGRQGIAEVKAELVHVRDELRRADNSIGIVRDSIREIRLIQSQHHTRLDIMSERLDAGDSHRAKISAALDALKKTDDSTATEVRSLREAFDKYIQNGGGSGPPRSAA